ncbi:hypothetical protein [Spirillospora sp. NPDC029432]|uniref:hypothetical protein n=1 Tax=Spirillospora sp. NPDC029432 TaxID=3154599 RepID=UPI00345372F1
MLLFSVVAGWTVAQRPPRTEAAVREPFVVIGVAGLAWGDIRADQTPRLWRLLGDGAAAGAATVRTTKGVSCAADGWLSLSAGQAAAAPRRADGTCGPLPDVRRSRVEGWRELADAQQGSEFSPRPGRLGDALGDRACAVGPGAALALADSDGRVRRYRETFEPGCPITVVDGGQVVRSGQGRLRSLAEIDRFAGSVLDRLRPGTSVLVQGVTQPPGGTPELAVSMLGPADFSFLTVNSTRWDGVVRLLDVPSTLLGVAGVPEPAEFAGAPFSIGGPRPHGSTATVHRLGDISMTDQVLRRWSGILLAGAALAQALLFRRAGALVLAALPAAAYLVTLTYWWKAPLPDLALWAGLAGVTGAVAWALRSPLLLSGVTFGVLVLDGVTGTALHRASPFGPSALYGGRYYGFGNSTFAIFAVAALVFAGLVAAELCARGRRREAVAAVAAVGAVACVVDTWPTWGADVGGGLALVPGFVILALSVAGARITGTRVVAALLGGVLLVAAAGVADWLRPAADRTHAGRFVQTVIDGEAWGMIGRKAGYALSSLGAGPLAWGTVAVLGLAVWALARQPSWLDPALRPALVAVLVTCAAGALVNDYGIRLVTYAFVMLLPLVALSVHRRGVVVPQDGADAEGSAGPVGR